MRETDLEEDSEEIKQYSDRFRAEQFVYANLDDVLDHFDYIRGLDGMEHIGKGRDFGGVGDSLPEDLKDVSQYPNLVRDLLERGYSEADC